MTTSRFYVFRVSFDQEPDFDEGVVGTPRIVTNYCIFKCDKAVDLAWDTHLGGKDVPHLIAEFKKTAPVNEMTDKVEYVGPVSMSDPVALALIHWCRDVIDMQGIYDV